MKYDFTAIEKKWQEKWLEEKPFTAVTGDKTREKFYGLIEFPYPSGQGLHVGHAASLHRHGHHLPQEADAGLQRAVPHRL